LNLKLYLKYKKETFSNIKIMLESLCIYRYR